MIKRNPKKRKTKIENGEDNSNNYLAIREGDLRIGYEIGWERELNKVRGEIKIGIAMRLGFGGGKRKGC